MRKLIELMLRSIIISVLLIAAYYGFIKLCEVTNVNLSMGFQLLGYVFGISLLYYIISYVIKAMAFKAIWNSVVHKLNISKIGFFASLGMVYLINWSKQKFFSNDDKQ